MASLVSKTLLRPRRLVSCRSLLLTAFVTLAVLRSHAASIVSDKVLATIDGLPIRQSAFEQFIGSGLAGSNGEVVYTNAPPHREALEAYFDLQVLSAKARKEGIDRSTNFQKACELMEMKLLVTAISERDRAIVRTNRQDYMDGIKVEVDLKPTALATNDGPIVLGHPSGTNALLATIGATAIRESDFEWFLKDAFRAEQRRYVYNQPGARTRFLNSYLNMKALEAKSRKDKLDQGESFNSNRAVLEARLLAEFLQERDRMMPWQLTGSETEKSQKVKDYLQALRAEMKFKNLVRN